MDSKASEPEKLLRLAQSMQLEAGSMGSAHPPCLTVQSFAKTASCVNSMGSYTGQDFDQGTKTSGTEARVGYAGCFARALTCGFNCAGSDFPRSSQQITKASAAVTNQVVEGCQACMVAALEALHSSTIVLLNCASRSRMVAELRSGGEQDGSDMWCALCAACGSKTKGADLVRTFGSLQIPSLENNRNNGRRET